MAQSDLSYGQRLVIVVATLLLAAPVSAEKPANAGRENQKYKPHHEQKHEKRNDVRPYDEKHESRGDNYNRADRYFNDQHRTVIQNYYADEFRIGRCPPGLAKKHNGCQPPGQAKKWALGRPLPRDVVFYDLPDTIIRQIGYPPAGYRFVRVASDILMIAIGSGLVVDAISDLSGMQ
ncbi:hypothetical protein IVG45_17440 [Methylomonas sp. LL1]|uniref:hypothetical protein n=1 Tax=Methylomonas sp. LL1 TaxID=2785785 RepID=UPI0018C412E7|nr:hypothetical protein [Methylomonas sp. LL1]QPK62616.1 hypothetical protein IVG45_17440 [Methylomonas sp. LL1]